MKVEIDAFCILNPAGSSVLWLSTAARVQILLDACGTAKCLRRSP